MDNDLKEKIKSSFKNGFVSKILLLLVTAAISFYPFFSIQKKLNQSIGDQPKILGVTYTFTVVLAIVLVWIIIKTRPKKD